MSVAARATQISARARTPAGPCTLPAPHPHLPLSSASIHPCKHAHVMKKLLDSLSEGGKEPSVEHYLVIFLKFIASIVPTIDYDYTMAADIGGS